MTWEMDWWPESPQPRYLLKSSDGSTGDPRIPPGGAMNFSQPPNTTKQRSPVSGAAFLSQ